MSFIRFGLLSVALISTACGANVVFGEDGGEGGNGAGANNTGAGNTGAGNQGGSTSTFNTTVSNPDTTTGIEDACEQLCRQHAQCLDGSCLESCKQAYVPGCESQADAMIRCLTDALTPDCDFPEEQCGGEFAAYQECTGGGEDCFTDFCEEGQGGCRCTGFCFGSEIQQSCAFDNNGQARCECFIDGEFWGECEDGGFACSIEEGCCREFFFEGDG